MNHASTLELICAAARRYGERPALHANGKSYSYSDLIAIANGIRKQLIDAGHGASPRIGVVTGDDVHTYASLLAIWSVGAAYVPLNVSNPVDRNLRIIDEADLDVVLTSRPTDQWASHLPADTTAVLHTPSSTPINEALHVPEYSPERLAYLFFTSGSTGTPKGVPITHSNLAAFMDSALHRLGYDFGPDDRFLQMFELTFDLSVMTTFVPWCVGGCCYAVPEKGIAYMNIIEILTKHKITVALMVPSVLPYMHRFFNEIELPSMRLSLFCGEALMQDMIADWSQCVPNARLENVYGPTEATIFCTTYPWDKVVAAAECVNGIVPIGTPMPGMETVVLDEHGRASVADQKGELALIGSQVMAGYWRDEGRTRQAIVSVELAGTQRKAYKTGDICYVNTKGNLIYCGRVDSQVKIDGHRIELGEIEHFARQYVGTSNVAVVVAKDATGRDLLHLFVGAGTLDVEALKAHLSSHLPDYMQPREIVVLSELPLNLNGKIDRPALARRACES